MYLTTALFGARPQKKQSNYKQAKSRLSFKPATKNNPKMPAILRAKPTNLLPRESKSPLDF
jgi:hypothetical protein